MVDILSCLASFTKILIVRLLSVVACSHILLISWLDGLALYDSTMSY